MTKAQKYLLIIGSFLIAAIVCSWFKQPYINGGDFYFPMERVADPLANYGHIWTDAWGMGLTNSRAIPQLPFQYLLSAASHAGIPLPLMERLLFVFLFLGSGIGIYWLTGLLQIFSGKHAFLGRAAAALFYMFNPFNVIFYWHILDGMVFVYAFLPLLLSCYLAWYERRKAVYAAGLFIGTFFAGYTFSNPLVIPVFWGQAFIFHFLCAKRRKEPLARALWFYIRAVLLWSLLNAWWLLPLVLSSRIELAGLSKSVGSPTDTLTAFSQNTSLLNLMRLSGLYWAFGQEILGDAYYTYAHAYAGISMQLISLLIPLVALAPLCLRRLRRSLLWLYLITFLYLFIAKGSHGPFGKEVYRFLFTLPFMEAFRAPVHKVGGLLSLHMAILFGYGIAAIADIRAIPSRIKFPALAAVLFLCQGVYAFPLWTGEVIHRGGKVYPSFHVRVPGYYRQAADFFDKDKGEWRFYPIPQSPTFNVAYKWEHGFIGGDPSFHFFRQNGVYSTVDEVPQQPYIKLRDTAATDIVEQLRLMNVRYILLHKDAHDQLWDIFTGKHKPVTFLSRRLAEQKGITLAASFGELDIYKIDDRLFLPRVYVASGDASLTFTKHSPTRYTLRVSKARQPFMVAFSENFSPGWSLSMAGRVINARHSMLDGFANSWLVDPAGLGAGEDFSLELCFKPQEYVYWGAMCALCTALALLGGFAWKKTARRRS